MDWSPLVPELFVSDYRESIGFYDEMLGATVEFTRDEPPFAYLSVEDAQLMIQEHRVDERWVTGALTYPYGRGVNLQIEVTTLDPYVERCQSEGYPLFEAPEEWWYRAAGVEHGQREFLVQDPDGYLLRFVESLGTR